MTGVRINVSKITIQFDDQQILVHSTEVKDITKNKCTDIFSGIQSNVVVKQETRLSWYCYYCLH
jgi:hypothetical protein